MRYIVGRSPIEGCLRHAIAADRLRRGDGCIPLVWLDIPERMPRSIVARDVWILRRHVRAFSRPH